jgi:hypothetical protein
MNHPPVPPSRLTRRQALRGLGTLVALPFLESVAPRAAAATMRMEGPPRRMAFVYFPNGAIMDQWTPQGAGTDWTLSQTLEPLAPIRSTVQVISGLDHQKANANGDGAGDHARANATFLTGAQARKTAGADIRAGISVDQLAAQRIGHHSRLPSLELSCDKVRQSGRCDSGYSCAYQYNLSWRNETSPMAPEVNPRLVFERLFGGTRSTDHAERRGRQMASRKSVLDFVGESARDLARRAGSADRRKLEQYLDSVRATERRIEQAEQMATELPRDAGPSGIPDSYREYVRVMYDLMVLAFQTDSTRIATFLLAHDGSNRRFKELGINNGHHEMSHHRRDPNLILALEQIDRFYVEQFAYFLQKMQATEDQGRSLLDQSMIVYGCAISDGNRHKHQDLPVVLAGGGGGSLRPGRHVRLQQGQPACNLYVSLLQRMGVEVDQFGDSTGSFERI